MSDASQTAVEVLGEPAFDGARLRRPGRWAVAFVADWCPFCRRFRPRFEALAGALPCSLAFADVTSEESPLWDVFGIEVIPTVVAFQDGAVVGRVDGRAGEDFGPGDLDRVRALFPSRP